MKDLNQLLALITLNNVTKVFETSAGSFEALKGISLTIKSGEFITVTGKSGSGKTTLMNMISGIDKPTSGEVSFCGKSLSLMKESRLSRWRGRSIGIVFQFFQLLPTLSVIENVMLPMDFCGTYPKSQRRERALKLLKEVGIEGQADKFPTALSGGEQQRAAIARALANNSPVILADEPTGNLDSATAADIIRIFKDLVKEGKTVIIVTHDPDIALMGETKITLSDGRLTAKEACTYA